MAEKIFAKGIRTFNRRDNAPTFILGSIVITLEDFREFVNGEGKQYLTDYQGKKQLRLTVLQSDQNGINLQVDTFKPSAGAGSPSEGKIEPNTQTTNRNPSANRTGAMASDPNDLLDGERPRVLPIDEPSNDLPFRFAPIFKINV